MLTSPCPCSTPTLCCLPLCCPAATPSAGSRRQRPPAVQRPLPSSGSRCQLPFASPYHFRIQRDFRSKNPLSGFAPKQTKESPALAGNPYSTTYHPFLPLSFIHNKLQHHSTTSRKTRTFTGSNNRTYKILKGFGRPLKKNNK